MDSKTHLANLHQLLSVLGAASPRGRAGSLSGYAWFQEPAGQFPVFRHAVPHHSSLVPKDTAQPDAVSLQGAKTNIAAERV